MTLRLFIAVVEEGTLARTAARENIAVSAISRRISDLEARCGVLLLDRHDRGVQPTAAGRMLFARALNLMELLEQTVLEMEAVRGGTRGHIRVYAHMSAVSGLLPQRIVSFLAAHPGIDVQISEFTSREVLHAVRTGMADVGFVSVTENCDDLHFYPWEHNELVALLPKGHALLGGSSVRFADLIEEPFIGMQRDGALLNILRQSAALLERDLKERAYASSFEGVRNMVAAGLGIAVLPRTAVSRCENEFGLEVRPLDEPWAQREMMLCIRDPHRLSAAANLLVDYLRSQFVSV